MSWVPLAGTGTRPWWPLDCPEKPNLNIRQTLLWERCEVVTCHGVSPTQTAAKGSWTKSFALSPHAARSVHFVPLSHLRQTHEVVILCHVPRFWKCLFLLVLFCRGGYKPFLWTWSLGLLSSIFFFCLFSRWLSNCFSLCTEVKPQNEFIKMNTH